MNIESHNNQSLIQGSGCVLIQCSHSLTPACQSPSVYLVQSEASVRSLSIWRAGLSRESLMPSVWYFVTLLCIVFGGIQYI